MLRFFEHRYTREALRELAKSPRLRVIVGAGASMEVGLPSWSGLVDNMLRDVVDATWPGCGSEFLARTSGNPLLAAELVDAVASNASSGGSLDELIRKHLYAAVRPDEVRPGPLANAIAVLHARCRHDMRIVTTNYDELLEVALRNLAGGPWTTVKSYVQQRSPGRTEVAVTHLHGIVASRSRGKVILSEGDYHRMQRSTHGWQQRMMADFLRDPRSRCLFIGASLTDSNMLRYLYQHANGLRHYAIFVRPHDAGSTTRAAWEQAETERWQRLGIKPLYANHYADVTQFVHELSSQRSSRRQRHFSTRLNSHLDRSLNSGVLTESRSIYSTVQHSLSDRLGDWLKDLRDLLKSRGVRIGSEVWQLGLWSLYPASKKGGEERAILLASSDRIMTDPASISPIELRATSSWVAVQAMCAGLPAYGLVDTYATRWRYVRAVPVFTECPRLPLGAVALSSQSPRTSLGSMSDALKTELDQTLQEVGLALLTA
ncbi:MAG: hypothetical protein JWO57_333 [Pseudonocardiales bacterium]|nr:hypothetical protein [Pseudonocardiales bacterium]